MVEQTLVLIKPDATEKEVWLQIIDRYRDAGFFIKKTKLVGKMNRATAKKLYSAHRQKPFFDRLINFTTSGPIIALLIEGEYCITSIRKFNGSTDPEKAKSGTIRAEFGTRRGEKHENAVHSSDSPESAQAEITLFFNS